MEERQGELDERERREEDGKEAEEEEEEEEKEGVGEECERAARSVDKDSDGRFLIDVLIVSTAVFFLWRRKENKEGSFSLDFLFFKNRLLLARDLERSGA